jgi:hypothetical protein
VKPNHHQPSHQRQYLALPFQLGRPLLHRQHQHQLGGLLGLTLVALVPVMPNHQQPPQQLQYLALLQQLVQGLRCHHDVSIVRSSNNWWGFWVCVCRYACQICCSLVANKAYQGYKCISCGGVFGFGSSAAGGPSSTGPLVFGNTSAVFVSSDSVFAFSATTPAFA